jgi:hypothetical protein
MNPNRITVSRITGLVALVMVFLAGPPLHAALPLQPEQVVVTCFSGIINYYSSPPTVTPNLNNNGYVVAKFDTQTGNIGPLIPPTTSPPELWDTGDVPPFSGFHNETGQRWNAQRLGEVFGICVDDGAPPNIYVTATECYNVVGAITPLPKGPGGPGGVYRLDGTTGASSFGSLPNNAASGPGLGNVCFRRAGNGTGYLYVSDLEDGMIYRMNATSLTAVGTPFDHGVQGRTNQSLTAIADDGTPGLTQFGRRIWGVQTYQNRLYYAVWWEDSRNISLTESNEIWSVALDNNGDFIPTSAQRHFALPNFATTSWSHPAASIDFSPSGKMFLAERYWQYQTMVLNATFGAHHTRILRYWLSGPNWVTDPSVTHQIGGDASTYFTPNMVGANSAGGVAVNCDESVWGTGDMYAGSYSTPPNIPFGLNDLGYVYGALRIPTGGNSMYAGYGYGCFAIDLDGNTNSIAKFGVGAIATVRDCCLPPPVGMVAWWPLDETTGAPTYADLSGNGNTALVEGGGPLGNFGSPTPIPGKVAGASSFLDSNTRGRAPNAPSLNFGTGSFSLDCWIRPVLIGPTAWQTIVDKFDTNSLNGYTVGISNGTVVLQVGDGTTYTHIGPAINYGVWNFVAVNINRTANSVRFYVNGVGSGPQALIPTGSFNNTRDLLIGAPYAPNIISESALDEIELFNRVLTTNELNDLWVADALGKCKSGQPPCSNSVVSIVCPTNITVACAPVVYYPPPQATTSCGTITNITCTPPSGSSFPAGPTVVTCTAYDSLGNSNSCTFTITVTPDVVPPVLDCQCLTNSFHEQLNVVGCTAIVPSLCRYNQCATDNCGLANCSQSPPAGTPVGPGVTPITVTVWDFAGNSNSCVVLMTVTPPPGGCAGPCDPVWKFLNLAITSTNGIFTGANGSIKASTSGGPFMAMNNSAYGSQFPVLFGASGIVTGYVAQAQLSATYSVTFDLSTYALTPGTVFGIWNTTEESNTYKIQVYDCSSNLIAPPFPAGTFSFLGWDDDLLSGNIGWYHLTLNPTTGLLATAPFASPNTDCDAAFWTNLPPNACRIVVTGNSIPDADGVVFYFAEPKPCCEITCPTNIIVTTCSTNAVVVYPAPSLTNCAADSVLICNPPSGSSFPLGTNTVTCSVVGAGGATTSCQFKVIVTTPPGGCGDPCTNGWKFLDLAITSTNGIFTGAKGSIKASTSGGPFMSLNNTAYGSQFPVLFPASGIVTGYLAQAHLGATYSVTFDLSGYALTPGTVFGIWNTTEETDTYKIQVYDCSSNLIAPPFPAGTFSFLGWDDDSLSGNIGWYHLTLNPATGLLATAPFASPNTDCDAAFWTNLPPNACRIVVTGTTIPAADGVAFYFAEPQPCCEITCPTNITVTTCGTNAVVYYPAPVLSNCGSEPYVICNPPSGSTFPVGTNTVTCSVVDALGGVLASCEFKVIVLQNSSLPPWTVICPPFTASVNVTGCPPKMPNLASYITIVTNCTLSCPPIVTQSIPAGTPLTAGNYVAIVNICDCLTNCTVCDIAVNAYVIGGNPTITCPPNQVITTCGTNTVVKYKVQATGYTGAVICTPPSGSTFPLGTTWVTCTATNACGGIATCSFSITVKKPSNKWDCYWNVGVGLPFETVGGATFAIMPVTEAERAIGPVGPTICVFPNPLNPVSGVLLHPGTAQRVTFTTVLDFTAPLDAEIKLSLPPDPLNPDDPPILSFRNKGPKGYCVKTNKRFIADPNALYRSIAVNTNGALLDSFTWTATENATNEPFILAAQPGVTNCHVTVELNMMDGSISLEFDGPVTYNAARKGWDGCIYGPDRPRKKPPQSARVIVMPPVAPGQPPFTDLFLSATDYAEVAIAEPTLTAQGRKWGDGHVTLMKAYDDGESMRFAPLANGGGVQVDLGHAASFDLHLTKFETNTIPGEELLTRTIGPIALTNRPTPPPFLDAMLLKEKNGTVECTADFSNLDAIRVDLQLLNNGILIATGSVTGPIIAPIDPLVLDHWPERVGHLPGNGAVRLTRSALFTIEGFVCDEVQIIPERPPGTPHPDYFSGLEFIASEDADWGVEEMTTTSICVAEPVAILETSGNVTVTWTGTIFRLQGAEQIAGPWYDLGAASPVTVPAASSARFFRLVCD